MKAPSTISLFVFLCGLACSSAADVSTTGTAVGSLYAYGTNLSGFPLFYADGKALLGYRQPENASTVTNLTFTLSDSNSLIAFPNNTALTQDWTYPKLYMDVEQGAFADAGFTSASDNNTTTTTTGFRFWGRTLIWTASDDTVSVGRSFWAEPTKGEEGLWTLLWNSDNVASESAIPVVLKKQAPTTSGD